MATGHLSVRAQQRSRGHSFAAALAYRWGVHLYDCFSGESHDFSRRTELQEIAHTGVGSYDGLDASWSAADPQLIANRIDGAERRGDAVLSRDIESAIPHELDDEARVALVEEWADELAERFHTPVPWAIHAPPKDGDSRNVHVHSLVPDRAVADDGLAMGHKLRRFNFDKGRNEILGLRTAWQDLVNGHLHQAGIDQRIDMSRTRPDGEPSSYLGPRAAGRERRRQEKLGRKPDGRGVLAHPLAHGSPDPRVRRAASHPAKLRSRDSLTDEANPAQSSRPESAQLSVRQSGPDLEVPTPRRERRRRGRAAAPESAQLSVRQSGPDLEVPTPRRERRRRGRAAAPESAQLSVRQSGPDLEVPTPRRERRRRGRAAAPESAQLSVRQSGPDLEVPTPRRERRRRGRAAAPESAQLSVRQSGPDLEVPTPRRERRRRGRAAAPLAGKSPTELKTEIERLRGIARDVDDRLLALAVAVPEIPSAPKPPLSPSAGIDFAAARRTAALLVAERHAQREAEITRQSTAAPSPTPKPRRVPSQAEHEESAAEKRLRAAVDAKLEELGAEWIRAAAGYANAYPSLGNLASFAANAAAKTALEPHVQPFAVPEKRKFRSHMTRRDHDRHKAALDRATTQWTRYFAKARKQLTDTVHAAAWPPYRDELRARTARIEKERVAATERKAKTEMTIDVPIGRKSKASSKPRQPTSCGKDVGQGPGDR